MRLIAVTQRVDVSVHGERRDALDQRWAELLHACGFTILPLPNRLEAALVLMQSENLAGLILTGGNDLAAVGGDAPERDQVEEELVARAAERGACRSSVFVAVCSFW